MADRWRNRIVGHGEEAPDQLLSNPWQWRVHPKAQQDSLKAVLDEVGWVQNVVVNKRTGHMVDGHARAGLAISLEEPLVPVVYVDLSEEEEKLILATLDPLGAMAAADKSILKELLESISATSEETKQLLERVAVDNKIQLGLGLEDIPEPQFDRAEELQRIWGTARGQVWGIGKHRLMCGDSLEARDVAILLDGKKCRLVVTDPPYGVQVDHTWRVKAVRGQRRARSGKISGDDRANWADVYPHFHPQIIYAWHSAMYGDVVKQSLERIGYIVRQQIIWVKKHFVLGRSHYHWPHEPCWYAVKKGANAHWLGDRSQTTVWEYASPIALQKSEGEGDATVHPTQKPIEIFAKPIQNHCTQQDIVADPFIGAGTAIVAAEALGRACYGMEIDPGYTAVTLQRLSDMRLEARLLNGKKASK